MKTLTEYCEWFRGEAGNLPIDVRRAVLAALEHNAPRQVFLALNPLWEARKLPPSWGPVLDNFYGLFC